MGKGWLRSEWLAQLGACVGYALAFLAMHALNVGQGHWHLYAALQLICLLLVPYRYWVAILIGETLPNAYFALSCLADFGPTWVAIRMIPEMLLSMPIVWLCRSRLNIFPSRHLVNVKALLMCVLMVSVVLSVYSFVLMFSSIHVPKALYSLRPEIMAGYITGNYAGLLTLVPWALIARLDYRKGRVKEQVMRLWSSKLLADAFGIALPVIALLAVGASTLHDAPTQLIEMGMFIPAAWLTAKHGWRAAALAGTVVLICDGLLQPRGLPALAALETIAVLCVAVSGLYALGAKVTAQNLRDERERVVAREVQLMARQTISASERKMRQAAERLEFVAGSLHIANSQVLEHMRRIMPNIESHGFYKQAVRAHEQVYRLAESLHPAAWRDRGLPAALNETIARALDEAGIAYSCEIGGRGFTMLEASVHTAIYRTACEAIVYVASQLSCSRVKLRVRAGVTNDHRWVVVRVEGFLHESVVANAVYFNQHRKDLAAKLGANLASVDEMRNHAKAFDGALHLRSNPRRIMVSALLHSNTTEVQKEKASAPLRLWVN
jgi:two-component system, NarL family, sensor histidine kinase FusK